MKYSIKFFILSVTIGFFMVSCGTNYSVTKRQHSKGYFVTSNKKYTNSSHENQMSQQNDVATNQIQDKAASEINETKQAKKLKVHSTESITPDDAQANTESVETKKTSSYSTLATDASSSSQLKEQGEVKPRSVLKTAKNSMDSTVTAVQRRSHDRGLSLLWIIIIVLLILWALGLISGIGTSGVIHLLLVIALILLILWLFRVI